ncbi:MAG: Rpn family recombination-promoting nuclease/putative transposase [Bacteroidota bacterium]
MSQKAIVSFDFAIKYLLKSKKDYQIVEGFISALLQAFGYPNVKIKSLLESESNKEQSELKQSIADLVVEDAEANKYIVEIDRAYTSTFIYKACFNASRLIVDSLEANEDYSTIQKVFHINLLYFVPSSMKAPLYHGETLFKGLEATTPVEIDISKLGSKKFGARQILPEYFVISVPLFNDEIQREIDEWLYVLKHSAVREDFHSPYMKQVSDRLSVLKLTAGELATYRRERKEALKERDYLTAAEEKGREEGIQEGIEKGREKTAKNMLSRGYAPEEIQALTGLSLPQIAQLAQDATHN